MRAVIIPVDPQVSIHEVDVNLAGDYELIRSYPVDERFLNTEQSVVLAAPFTSDTLPSRDHRPPRNERATVLYAPRDSRSAVYLLGDVFVVGQDFTDSMVKAVALDPVVGATDIIELVERWEFR